MERSKVSRIINSISLFEEKKKKVRFIAINGELNPILTKQLESIIKQCKKYCGES